MKPVLAQKLVSPWETSVSVTGVVMGHEGSFVAARGLVTLAGLFLK